MLSPVEARTRLSSSSQIWHKSVENAWLRRGDPPGRPYGNAHVYRARAVSEASGVLSNAEAHREPPRGVLSAYAEPPSGGDVVERQVSRLC